MLMADAPGYEEGRLRMKRILFYLCLAFALLLVGACGSTQEPAITTEEITTAEEPNPFVGTWVLNVDKSTFDPPSSAPKSTIFTIVAQDGGLKWTSDNVDAAGKATKGGWSGKYDGKDYALTENADVDAIAAKMINANTFESVSKKGGEVVGTGRGVVSEDGKTLTLTSETKNAQGQETTSVGVYDKQ
jgi:hypothetical protein